jgi:uncharacterized protein
MSGYRQPEFLTENDEPRHRVRCPIHGFIHYSENEREVIDHRLFRRLRYIRQLALTEFVYPGATHTRFEHSLGVMEVATRAFDSLAAKRGDVLEATFGGVAGFEDRPMALARQYLRLAALLHDMGHASFSHAAEAVAHGGFGHEALSIQLVRESGHLGGMLDRLFGPGCAERVAQILEGAPELPPQLQVLQDLVSGQMDADRTDYLLRDSHHCGVEYGHFGYRRMIESLELQMDAEGRLEIALHRDGIHTFEALIQARYQMNTQVYYHRLRRIYDLYLLKYFAALGDEAPTTPDQVIAHNDVTMMARIFQDAVEGEGERQKWARRITERNHHCVVHETGVDADAMGSRRSRDVLSALQQRYPDCEFLMDKASATIHKLLVPGDYDDDELVALYLVGRDGLTRLVGEESQILRYIPRRFQCVRIFADVPRQKEDLRREMQELSARVWRDRGGH